MRLHVIDPIGCNLTNGSSNAICYMLSAPGVTILFILLSAHGET